MLALYGENARFDLNCSHSSARSLQCTKVLLFLYINWGVILRSLSLLIVINSWVKVELVE